MSQQIWQIELTKASALVRLCTVESSIMSESCMIHPNQPNNYICFKATKDLRYVHLRNTHTLSGYTRKESTIQILMKCMWSICQDIHILKISTSDGWLWRWLEVPDLSMCQGSDTTPWAKRASLALARHYRSCLFCGLSEQQEKETARWNASVTVWDGSAAPM